MGFLIYIVKPNSEPNAVRPKALPARAAPARTIADNDPAARATVPPVKFCCYFMLPLESGTETPCLEITFSAKLSAAISTTG